MRRALGIGVLVIAATFAVLVAPAPVARAANVSIHLYGSTAGWSFTSGAETRPGPTITTNTTDHVTLTLTGDDLFPHQFLLDYNGDNASASAEPTSSTFTGTTTVVTFASAPAGTYFYICTIHGWAAMRGVWIVLGPASDTEPPWITSLAANPSHADPGGSVNITARATDNASSVMSMHARVTGPGGFDQNFTMSIYRPSLSQVEWYVDRTYADNGTYTVTAWAEDDQGNLGWSRITFTIGGGSQPPPPGATLADYALPVALALIALLAILLLVLFARIRRRKKGETPQQRPPGDPGGNV